MIKFYNELEQAIQQTKKVEIRFKEKETWILKDKICIPFDYWKTKRVNKEMFYFFDLNSSEWKHVLWLNPEQLIELNILDEAFTPSDEYITWKPPYEWNIKRDWWIYS